MKGRGRLVRLREAAARLAVAIPRERLHPAVIAWADASSARSIWSVALSGGADSLALLLLVWAHWPAHASRLRALHFNHRLRGRAAEADARFCRDVCGGLGVTFLGAEWRNRPREVSEAQAREARHAFFRRYSRQLWLGHQQDDIAETALMRLARGSGTAGLAAPRPVQRMPGGRWHLRPLLTLKKLEIVAALKVAGIAWREDATNSRDVFFRNRIRRSVIGPWIQASGRDALSGAARSRELLEEDDAALEAWVDEIDPLDASGALDITVLASRPVAIVRRALHRWLLAQSPQPTLSRQAFDALLHAARRGEPTRQSVGSHGFAVIRRGRLVFEAGR